MHLLGWVYNTQVLGDLVDEIWGALDVETEAPGEVRLVGPRDVLASVFPVVEIAAASVGATLLCRGAAGTCARWRPAAPAVLLDTRHLAFAVRSERFTTINGQPGREGFARLSWFFETRDGWIRLHANYLWHRDRTLGVLQADATPQAVARAVRAWPKAALEDVILEAGSCAAALRSPAEWVSHPQGKSVQALPLIDMVKVASSTAEREGSPASPQVAAAGLRVLDSDASHCWSGLYTNLGRTWCRCAAHRCTASAGNAAAHAR